MISNGDSEETDNTVDLDKQLELDITALEIVTLQKVVRQNSGQVERLVDKLGKCLADARALADLDAPYSEDVMQSLWTASDTIETIVKADRKDFRGGDGRFNSVVKPDGQENSVLRGQVGPGQCRRRKPGQLIGGRRPDTWTTAR